MYRSAAVWLCNSVLYSNAHLVLQPQLVPHTEHILSQVQKLFLRPRRVRYRKVSTPLVSKAIEL